MASATQYCCRVVSIADPQFGGWGFKSRLWLSSVSMFSNIMESVAIVNRWLISHVTSFSDHLAKAYDAPASSFDEGSCYETACFNLAEDDNLITLWFLQLAQEGYGGTCYSSNIIRSNPPTSTSAHSWLFPPWPTKGMKLLWKHNNTGS